MRYRRARVPGGRYFFTLVTARRKPIFASDEAVRLLMECFSYVQVRHPFEMDAYSILPDHLHAMWTLPEGDSDYSTRWMLVKTTFSRKFRQRFGADGSPIRQSRYRQHTISDDREYVAHVEYMHFNPVRHRLTKAPKDWLHSSFLAWVADGDYPIDWAADAEPMFPTTGWGE